MQTHVFGEATYSTAWLQKIIFADLEILTFPNQFGVFNYKNSRILSYISTYSEMLKKKLKNFKAGFQ